MGSVRMGHSSLEGASVGYPLGPPALVLVKPLAATEGSCKRGRGASVVGDRSRR